jgi:hypothetical protein
MKLKSLLAAAFAAALVCAPMHARGAATLLPNGEQCFSAATSTSGGSVGLITSFGTIVGGSGYANGNYSNVPLTGGSGQGATATIVVSGNAVTQVILSNPGFHYAATDVLSAANANLGGSGSGFQVPVLSIQGTGTGMVGTLGTIVPGTGGTAGSYGGVSLTGGTGSGATANITVSGGGITAVAILNPGVGYALGDQLSASPSAIGNVSGFSVPVASTAINSSLAGGSVAFYVPNTSTFKQTWKDAAQTQLNQNPVPLDANGCAVIYGSGIYRQVLQDSLGNIVWDKPTADTTAGNNVIWAGLASNLGTPNGIIVIAPAFTGANGTVINFIPIQSNTGPATINPSGFGAIPIVKDTAAGPISLTGTPSEIVTNNVVSLTYDATNLEFHLSARPLIWPTPFRTTIFTSNGTYTPAANLAYARVTAIGGGGAGGGSPLTAGGQVSCGAGGGSGGIAIRTFSPIQLSPSQAITVPPAAIGVSGATGSNGGTVTFGTFLTASGGGGGPVAPAGVAAQQIGGGAGVETGGEQGYTGNQGGVCFAYAAIGLTIGGLGAPGYLGQGQQQTTQNSTFPAVSPGAGGMGTANPANAAAVPGGTAAAGAVIIEEYTYQGN